MDEPRLCNKHGGPADADDHYTDCDRCEAMWGEMLCTCDHSRNDHDLQEACKLCACEWFVRDEAAWIAQQGL
jgi:hypothetical protein